MLKDLEYNMVTGNVIGTGEEFRYLEAKYKNISISNHLPGFLAKLNADFECGHGDTPEEALVNLRELLAKGLRDVNELLGNGK